MLARFGIALGFYYGYAGLIYYAFYNISKFNLTWFGWILFIGLMGIPFLYAIAYGLGMYEKRH